MKRKMICFLAILFWVTKLMAQQKPNIVFILSDDAGYADFSFMTDHLVPTPNIDEIAKHGIKFTDAHVSAAVCCPSRAGLLTGINQAEFGHVYNYVQGVKYNIPKEEFGIPLSQKLIGDYLRPLGYKTAIIGKWHEGFAEKFQPQNRGFDYAWGFLWGSSPYFTGKAKLVLEDGVSVPADSIPYMTDAIGNQTIKFIEKNHQQPFFVYAAFNCPHTPMQAKPEVLAKFRSKFKTEGRALNAAMTYTLDENVGKIIAKLKELNLFDNTLIVFTNDNGGQTVESFADNYPLRGRKGDIYEGGIRVPMAMMWKGHIPEGIVCDKVVSTLDLIPTFLYAAQNKQVQPQLDGISLLPVGGLKHPKMDKRISYWFLGHGIGAIRQGDWKLISLPNKAPELYNLRNDIAEKQNLYSEGNKLSQSLLKQYNDWKAKLPPPLWMSEKPVNDNN
ncbi:sulfatase-like hydrolase/transferase [Mucilaginibacter arboris]|uniref:Sulfatase-like hydrolase/transferase n=1 Tax=Mucilaginibacter arboris TaxID=2682090 RepID=A0A7K1STS5_9SPHI|nr:sulfatase-like hydrolase/transferase [Mucilaginibacter arboris]MVN20470.1 sulfatase-like hydrolase/transferase [Mucilaginibacter arboris]